MGSLSIEFTAQCNYRCPWCIKAEDLRTGGGPLPPKEFERIMLFAKAHNTDKFVFCGGEPLCHPNELLCAIRQIRETFPKAEIIVTTNGTGITAEIAERFNEERVGVTLSIEAEGYKGLKMLVENAAEPEKVITNINGIASLDIRSVRPDMNDFAAGSVLLRAVFPKAQIVVTPDRTRLGEYTLDDVSSMRRELDRLTVLAPDAREWFVLIGTGTGKCKGDVYRYDVGKKTIIHSCPYALHPDSGCFDFASHMKPDVYEAYRNAVLETLYGGEK